MTSPTPPEFQRQSDSYEWIPPMWVDADYYLDGKLVHRAQRAGDETPPEHEPGWTVQGAQHGEAA